MLAIAALFTTSGCMELLRVPRNLTASHRSVEYHVVDGDTGRPVANVPVCVTYGDQFVYREKSQSTDEKGVFKTRVVLGAMANLRVDAAGYLYPPLKDTEPAAIEVVRIYRPPAVEVVLELPAGYRGLLSIEPGAPLVSPTSRPVPVINAQGRREIIARPDASGLVRMPEVPWLTYVNRNASIARVQDTAGTRLPYRGESQAMTCLVSDGQGGWRTIESSDWLPDRPDDVAVWELGFIPRGASVWFVGTTSEAATIRRPDEVVQKHIVMPSGERLPSDHSSPASATAGPNDRPH